MTLGKVLVNGKQAKAGFNKATSVQSGYWLPINVRPIFMTVILLESYRIKALKREIFRIITAK